MIIDNLLIEIITVVDWLEEISLVYDSLEYTIWSSLTDFRIKSLINESLKYKPQALILVLTYTKFGYHILDNIIPSLPKDEFTIEKSIDDIFRLQNKSNACDEIPVYHILRQRNL